MLGMEAQMLLKPVSFQTAAAKAPPLTALVAGMTPGNQVSDMPRDGKARLGCGPVVCLFKSLRIRHNLLRPAANDFCDSCEPRLGKAPAWLNTWAALMECDQHAHSCALAARLFGLHYTGPIDGSSVTARACSLQRNIRRLCGVKTVKTAQQGSIAGLLTSALPASLKPNIQELNSERMLNRMLKRMGKRNSNLGGQEGGSGSGSAHARRSPDASASDSRKQHNRQLNEIQGSLVDMS